MKLTKKQVTRQSHQVNQGNTAGLVSSIVFTPHQGIELVNPEYVAELSGPKKEDIYLKPDSGFRTVMKQKEARVGALGV